MFQIKDGKISLNKTRSLTPKQLVTLNQMSSETDRNSYILSLMGLVRRRINVNRIKRDTKDLLAVKRKDSVLRHMEQLQQLDHDHKPNKSGVGLWVGVEIECFIPHQHGPDSGNCGCEYDENGELTFECWDCSNGGYWSQRDAYKWLRQELYDAKVSRCCIKKDGSLEDDEGHGVEITILFNTKYGFEPLHKLCKALDKAGCYVNETCGLHVHLDARHLKRPSVERVGASLGHSLPILKYLVPKSRQKNTYCELRVSKLVKITTLAGNNEERYCAINLTSYPKYKTIEIRLHQGTIDSKQIQSWIELLRVISNAKLTSPLKTFQDLINLTGMNESLVAYAEQLVHKYNWSAWPLLINGAQTEENAFDQIVGA
jgi:hypothetical protein